jgi:hypothetical protein
MDMLGPKIFFVMLAGVLGSLALTAAVRMYLRAAPPIAEQEDFVPLARTSQSALEMLPDADVVESDQSNTLK